jgi:hypothetical protein
MRAESVPDSGVWNDPGSAVQRSAQPAKTGVSALMSCALHRVREKHGVPTSTWRPDSQRYRSAPAVSSPVTSKAKWNAGRSSPGWSCA